jgi:hypothetical protein
VPETISPGVYIWIRKTVDWQDEAAFLAQCPVDLRPKVELWNTTFNVPFHLFRHRLRQIADLNHSRVEGAFRAGWDEIPDGSLVMPVDDDDWFAPGAARTLESEVDPGAMGYYWTAARIEVVIELPHRLYYLRRRLLPSTPPKWTCATNNYAIVKRPQAKELGNHMRASRWFDEKLERGGGTIKKLDGLLSLTNRNLGSQMTLRPLKPSISRAELLRKFRRYRRLYERSIPRGLEWSRPYLEEMAELMGALEVKGRG